MHFYFFFFFAFLYNGIMEFTVLPENRFPPVRVRGEGDLIFCFIFVRLGGPGVSTTNKISIVGFWPRGCGGYPHPFFNGDLPYLIEPRLTRLNLGLPD